jgi:hypothetical protein
MKLLSIAENKVTVALEWDDLAVLGLLCREAAGTGLFGGVGEGALGAYLDAFGAFCESAGMASWAPGRVARWCDNPDYTLAGVPPQLRHGRGRAAGGVGAVVGCAGGPPATRPRTSARGGAMSEVRYLTFLEEDVREYARCDDELVARDLDVRTTAIGALRMVLQSWEEEGILPDLGASWGRAFAGHVDAEITQGVAAAVAAALRGGPLAATGAGQPRTIAPMNLAYEIWEIAHEPAFLTGASADGTPRKESLPDFWAIPEDVLAWVRSEHRDWRASLKA